MKRSSKQPNERAGIESSDSGAELTQALVKLAASKPRLPAFGASSSSTGNTWPACGC